MRKQTTFVAIGALRLKIDLYFKLLLISIYILETGDLLFFQLPDSLPGLPPSTEEEYKDRKNKDKKDQSQVTV